MKKKLLAYFLVFAFASTSVLSGSVISYGQNDAEVSDSVNEMEEFSDGSTSELSLSDDMVIPNAGESAYAYSDTATSNGITLKVEWNDSRIRAAHCISCFRRRRQWQLFIPYGRAILF